MEIFENLKKEMKKNPLHMGLIDPDKQKPKKAGGLAKILEESGSNAIMVGGSTGINEGNLEKTVKAIKKETELPIIHFPTRADALTSEPDAIYFMSILNSKDRDKIIGQQVIAALYLKEMNIEKIPMGYLIIEPGMTVGEVSNATPIPREEPEKAKNYGLAAQYLGMKLLYLEAGSGAPEPVPEKMIQKCNENLEIPIIVGGGIRNPEQAKKITEAGADIIVTGTILEEDPDVKKTLKDLIKAIK